MKKFDSRAYSISDFLEWSDNKQLELNPKFQRRSVWTETAKSFLMDTIIRGKPIPKVFIRQKLNVQTKKAVKEVVDGQQRLRTILSFLHDGFVISKKHNAEYGGLYYSELNKVDDNVQENLLNYEISTDLLLSMPDSEVLDIFSRLNSYAVILNDQEKINANHFGPFKTLADKIAHSFNSFWIENKILKEQEILRMADVTLVADLLIAMCEGIKSKKQIKQYYGIFEKNFEYDTEALNEQFTHVIFMIKDVFGSELKTSEFRRIHIFYSLFTALFHISFGLKDLEGRLKAINSSEYARILNKLDSVNLIFTTEDTSGFNKDELQFLEDSRRATTDTIVRVRRTQFLVDLVSN